jgi:hypothetical protein
MVGFGRLSTPRDDLQSQTSSKTPRKHRSRATDGYILDERAPSIVTTRQNRPANSSSQSYALRRIGETQTDSYSALLRD